MQTLFTSPVPEVPTVPPNAATKTLTWQTNYNKKMANDGFIHLDLAPTILPIRSHAEQTIFIIKTADNSHPPISVHLVDMEVVLPHAIRNWMTLVSHGMLDKQFADYLFKKYPYEELAKKSLALYYYKQSRFETL